MPTLETILLYVILGAVLGIIWSLKKMYLIESKLVALDLKTEKLVEQLSKGKK